MASSSTLASAAAASGAPPASMPTLPSIPPEWATQDRGNEVIAIYWTEISIATLFICARLFARMRIRALGVDDITMTLAMLSFAASGGVNTKIAGLGGFRHVFFVPTENVSAVLLNTMIVQTLIVFAYGVGKFSIGYLILRLLPPQARKQRAFIWTVLIAVLLINWVQVVITWTTCSPREAAWNPLLPDSSCWTAEQKRADILAGSSLNVVVDVILAVFPVSMIWRLNMDVRRKISTVSLLGLGLLAAICGGVKLKYVDALFRTDPTWAIYDLDVWSGSELFVVIVCGSAPPCKPLWDSIFSGRRLTRSGRSGNVTYGPSKNDSGRHTGYEMMGRDADNGSGPASTLQSGSKERIVIRTDITVEAGR